MDLDTVESPDMRLRSNGHLLIVLRPVHLSAAAPAQSGPFGAESRSDAAVTPAVILESVLKPFG
jgi:hypothetical protein